MNIKLVNAVICHEVRHGPDEPYVLVIDPINTCLLMKSRPGPGIVSQTATNFMIMLDVTGDPGSYKCEVKADVPGPLRQSKPWLWSGDLTIDPSEAPYKVTRHVLDLRNRWIETYQDTICELRIEVEGEELVTLHLPVFEAPG